MKAVRYLRDAAVFAPCYLLLDWVSYIHPLGAFNITPWNPQPALAIAWMVLGGLRQAPIVLAAIVLADVLIRNVPAGYGVTLAAALVLTAGYVAIAWALRSLLQPKPRLHTLRQLTLFVAVVVPASAAIAAGFVGVLHAAGQLESGVVLQGWLRFWVGDAVGVLVTAPLFFATADAQRRRELSLLARRGETYLQAAVTAAALWLIFEGLGGDPARHFYFLFLPLIWIALRSGMAGAIVAIALVQIGVVLAIRHPAAQTLPVIELQALVAALTLTGLYLGVTVDERARASDSLRRSLKLAAAGEMAGAIAHEVNQPLTALTNYGRAGRALLEAGRTAELADVMERMLGEAQRAAEVVRRLRDFFRQGTTRLERLTVAELLEGIHGLAGTARGVPLTVEVDAGVPPVLVDRLQIELLLRNLLANAADAVAAQTHAAGAIKVTARRDDTQHVRIVVSDTGPGLAAAAVERVFEPFVSDKPRGMGLGLAVSRAIAEAHGGSLEARAASHGEFHLVLPIEPDRA